MQTLLTELTRHFDFSVPSDQALAQHTTIDTRMHQSTIFKDDTGCLELANKPDQFCPWTKHIGIKWHHFWDTVKNVSVVVQKIDTTLQLADPLTKPLPHPWFEQLRWLLMGWWPPFWSHVLHSLSSQHAFFFCIAVFFCICHSLLLRGHSAWGSPNPSQITMVKEQNFAL